MPAEVLWTGATLADYIVEAGAPYTTTLSNRFDSTYSRAALALSFAAGTGSEQRVRTLDFPPPASGETLWFHLRVHTDNSLSSSSGGVIYQLQDALGRALVRCVWNSSGGANAYTFTVEVNTGTPASPVWTDTGMRVPHATGSVKMFDFAVTVGSPNVLKVFNDNALFGEFSFTQAAMNTAVRWVLSGYTLSGSGQNGYSEAVVTRDLNTVAKRLLTRHPTGAGTQTAMTGTFAEVDEAVPDDNDNVSTNTAGQAESFTHGAITGFTGSVISVSVNARAKREAAGPQNLAVTVRVGTTTYDSPTKALNEGYQSIQHHWMLNPAGGAWDFSNAAGEFGVKALA